MPARSKKAAPGAGVNVLVTVTDAHRDKLDAVADRLVSAGMAVAEKFPLGGVIAGEVSAVSSAPCET